MLGAGVGVPLLRLWAAAALDPAAAGGCGDDANVSRNPKPFAHNLN